MQEYTVTEGPRFSDPHRVGNHTLTDALWIAQIEANFWRVEQHVRPVDEFGTPLITRYIIQPERGI